MEFNLALIIIFVWAISGVYIFAHALSKEKIYLVCFGVIIWTLLLMFISSLIEHFGW